MEFLKIPLFGLFSSEIMLSAKVCVSVTVCVTTCHSPSDLPGCFLSHFQWCLFAVPGSVWCANQIGGIFERTLTETDKYTSSTITLSCSKNDFVHHKRLLFCVYWWPMLWHKCHWIPWYYKISKHSCKLPLILHGSEVRCCKYSTMILVHKIWNHRADLSAANPWCKSPVLSHL